MANQKDALVNHKNYNFCNLTPPLLSKSAWNLTRFIVFYFFRDRILPLLDWDPVHYLGYCTTCNSTNLNPPFNPMTYYFDTSSVQAGNLCAFISVSQIWTSLKLFYPKKIIIVTEPSPRSRYWQRKQRKPNPNTIYTKQKQNKLQYCVYPKKKTPNTEPLYQNQTKKTPIQARRRCSSLFVVITVARSSSSSS